MFKPARRTSVAHNWKKYERKTSIRLTNIKKDKKNKTKPHRSKNAVALGLAVLLFLIALILVGKLFGFLGSINKTGLENGQKTYNWNGKSSLNLIVKTDNTYLLSYQPKVKSLTLYKFPEDLYLDTVYDFGKWPVRSIYDLGQAEKPPVGAILLKNSVGNSFNLIADGYIIINDKNISLSQLVDREKGSLTLGTDLISKSNTDLNLLEFLKVWWTIKSVRSDKIKTIDLEKSDLTNWLLLPDGSRVVALDPVKLSQFEESRFEDQIIKDEALSIGVFNATDYPGLAEKAAKIITNLGGRVIFTSNAPEVASKSMVLAKKSYTSDYLSEKFRLFCPQPKNANFWQNIPFFGSNSEKLCSSGNTDFDTSRADIIIILGEDSFLKFKR